MFVRALYNTFDGVKQIGGRNSKADLTRPALHIMEPHKLQRTEAVIHQAGVYETMAHGLLAQLYTMVKPVGQPRRKLKKKRRRRRRRKSHRVGKGQCRNIWIPLTESRHNALINEGHQDRHAVPAKNLIWTNTV